MNWAYAALALAGGALLPLQALINAQLGRNTAGALFASACSFLVGTAALASLLIASRQPLPALETMQRLPAWMWLGGLLGACFVSIATLAVPRLGASALVATVVCGQMLGALAYDRFGVLQPAQAIGTGRMVGAALVVVGVLLVTQPWDGKQ